MAYVKSTDIKVYPSAFRGKNGTSVDSKVFDPESRLYTERNISNPYIALSNYKEGSFVISETVGNDFEFVICGHYFKLTNTNNYFPVDENGAIRNYYGVITLNTQSESDPGNINLRTTNLQSFVSGSASLDEVPSGGSDSEFTALKIECVTGVNPSYTPSSLNEHALLLCTAVYGGDPSRVVPISSRLRYKPQAVFGGTKNGEDKPLNEYLETEEIKVNNLNITHNLTAGTSSENDTHSFTGLVTFNNNVSIVENLEIDGNLSVNTDVNTDLVIFDKYIAVKNSNDDYIWWVDTNGNIYQLQNNPQSNLVTLTNLHDAVITYTGSQYQADWTTNKGIKRYCTANRLSNGVGGFTHIIVSLADTYQKIGMSWDSTNSQLTIEYEE